jgi:hypothetical protein
VWERPFSSNSIKFDEIMNINRFDSVWKTTPQLQKFQAGSDISQLIALESEIGIILPMSFRSIYTYSNGLSLFNGNLNIYPLKSNDNPFSITDATSQHRLWEWQIPNEVLLFGDNGSESLYGFWIPDADRNNILPIIEIGELFEPDCMSLVATNLENFLVVQTAYFLMVYSDELRVVAENALKLLGIPQILWSYDPDDETLKELRRWADPHLPNYEANPYSDRLNLDNLRTQVSSLRGLR